jgi:hypothetical protein
MSDTSYFVMYIIESKLPRQRRFRPHELAFVKKVDALDKAAELREKFAHVGRQYRVTGYWDKRPW